MHPFVVIAIYVLVIIFAPFLSVWALNTLFFAGPLVAYAIPYTWQTWLAIIIFGGLLKSTSTSKS